MPTVTIDGQPYQAAVGSTILDVARCNGVWIPTLCHHPGCSPMPRAGCAWWRWTAGVGDRW